jgi:hypothetical protein
MGAGGLFNAAFYTRLAALQQLIFNGLGPQKN